MRVYSTWGPLLTRVVTVRSLLDACLCSYMCTGSNWVDVQAEKWNFRTISVQLTKFKKNRLFWEIYKINKNCTWSSASSGMYCCVLNWISTETSVDIQLRTRQYIPEDSELHTRRRENLKSRKNCTSCKKGKWTERVLNYIHLYKKSSQTIAQ
jgi:hypothetical protein